MDKFEQVTAALNEILKTLDGKSVVDATKVEEIQAKHAELVSINAKTAEELTAATKLISEKDKQIESLQASLNVLDADKFEAEAITAAIRIDQERVITEKNAEIEATSRKTKLQELGLHGEKIVAKAIRLTKEGFDEFVGELLEARQIAEAEKVTAEQNAILSGQKTFLAKAEDAEISIAKDGGISTAEAMKAAAKDTAIANKKTRK